MSKKNTLHCGEPPDDNSKVKEALAAAILLLAQILRDLFKRRR